MTGRAEVGRLKKRLDATFERIRDAGSDLELRSDFARYLCVLVSGYLERSVVELVLEHARNSGGPTLQRFIEIRTRHFANANASRLIEFLGSFNPDWKTKLEVVVIDELKDAVDSVVRLKNTIAHGESVGVTYARIEEYYSRVQKVIDEVADLCVPK
ncbi:MAG TPA: HEPN domain-containing protein [Candidatus Solibacter sp.]|nr:HEPN domain-containing protein [Candidatus Solibacter sp.]